jgi:mRNA-degrading endonuclease RelE of RelBE toxin-antitoxin system
MEFRIADTFTESLGRLTGEEQKAVKTTAFDLQMNPESPGLAFHKLVKARDRGFSSVRVNQDVRLIVHRSAGTLLLCTGGLEFRAVAVIACDDEVLPLQDRIEAVTDESDLAEVYDTERNLLYVACTRARDHLLVTAVAPASEFLRDLETR